MSEHARRGRFGAIDGRSYGQTGAQSLKDEWSWNALDLPFDQFPIPTLRGFKPRPLYVCVGGRIELSEQRAEQLKLFFAAERTDVPLDFRQCLRHDAVLPSR